MSAHGLVARDIAVPPAWRRATPLASWVPILCYHDVVPTGPAGPTSPYAVTTERFVAQMRLLHRLGYRSISVAEAARYARDGRPAPANVVALTFDDGYRSVVDEALPVLEGLGLRGTAYVVVDFLNAEADIVARHRARHGEPAYPRPEYLRDRDVRRLLAAGWELGCHTRTHPDLSSLPAAALQSEIVEARAIIGARFGDPAETFCYPYHRYSDAVEDTVVVAGYSAACGGYNRTHRPFDLSRISAPAHSPAALALRCSRHFWRLRRAGIARKLKRAVWRPGC